MKGLKRFEIAKEKYIHYKSDRIRANAKRVTKMFHYDSSFGYKSRFGENVFLDEVELMEMEAEEGWWKQVRFN